MKKSHNNTVQTKQNKKNKQIANMLLFCERIVSFSLHIQTSLTHQCKYYTKRTHFNGKKIKRIEEWETKSEKSKHKNNCNVIAKRAGGWPASKGGGDVAKSETR